MFPLIAIGAALIGGAVAIASNEKTAPRIRTSPSEAKADAPALPQSYLVTPVGGAERTPQVSALEAVRNLIV
jgi:hypothetical protein